VHELLKLLSQFDDAMPKWCFLKPSVKGLLFDVKKIEQFLNCMNGGCQIKIDGLSLDWENFVDHCADEGKVKEITLIGLVKKYGDDLPNKISQLEQYLVTDRHQAKVVLSTAHGCKGLEFRKVVLSDDFNLPFVDGKQKLANLTVMERERFSRARYWKDEMNLLYVAVTRAKIDLYVPKEVHDIFARKIDDFTASHADMDDTPHDDSNLQEEELCVFLAGD